MSYTGINQPSKIRWANDSSYAAGIERGTTSQLSYQCMKDRRHPGDEGPRRPFVTRYVSFPPYKRHQERQASMGLRARLFSRSRDCCRRVVCGIQAVGARVASSVVAVGVFYKTTIDTSRRQGGMGNKGAGSWEEGVEEEMEEMEEEGEGDDKQREADVEVRPLVMRVAGCKGDSCGGYPGLDYVSIAETSAKDQAEADAAAGVGISYESEESVIGLRLEARPTTPLLIVVISGDETAAAEGAHGDDDDNNADDEITASDEEEDDGDEDLDGSDTSGTTSTAIDRAQKVIRCRFGKMWSSRMDEDNVDPLLGKARAKLETVLEAFLEE